MTNSHLKTREGKIQKKNWLQYVVISINWASGHCRCLAVFSGNSEAWQSLTFPLRHCSRWVFPSHQGQYQREETVLSAGTGSCTTSEMCPYQDTCFSGSVAYARGFALERSRWSVPQQQLLGKCWPLNIVLLDLFLLCLSFADSVYLWVVIVYIDVI